ncbi:hypothetical protein Dsin_006153 [Dipteronia sinensis]|uniref:HPP transmembrane region domain-containing protein n=1 Tax=Dipteronia sinensis TaxID=43782 RepID=A0AAE0AXZ0_9ROSI|nr:hypothetical protein Dsin_006153 [Dipteronia sinensis]
MGTQLRASCCHHINGFFSTVPTLSTPEASASLHSNNLNRRQKGILVLEKSVIGLNLKKEIRGRRRRIGINGIVASSSSNVAAAPSWDSWKPPKKASSDPSLSDILWPSAGAFAAMAILGKIDQILAPKGVSMTIAPLGAVCAVLFASPSTPAARKYNMFMAQIGCAAIGVVAFTLLGPGWLARSTALAASIAFMIYARAAHPPAASLPLLFIDGVKLHRLNYWYALFPGAAGCVVLCLIVSSLTLFSKKKKFNMNIASNFKPNLTTIVLILLA